MASLLGGEYCIESLQQDVKDLQAILDEVHSRVGPIKYQSWKFPDKSSCDVDILKILERCQFNQNDEEECQLSHVMLYDMVIDRMVYLLQSFICFNEILLNVENGNVINTSPSQPTKKGNPMRSMSIGLTVKKCWGRITQIATLLQKIAKEVNSRSKLPGHELRNPSLIAESTLIPNENKTAGKEKHLEDTSDTTNDKDVSRDVRCTGCQTAETAYAPCETCSRAQSCLRDVGRVIIDLCKAQSLPTALEDYQSRYNESIPMSVADLVRWCKHQSKDLSRISRHMTSLTNQVTPLKSELASVNKNVEKLDAELQVCQSVFDRKEAEIREEFRRKEYRMKEAEKDLKKKISTLENIKAGMQEEINNCTWKISDLKDELLQKHREHLSMETSMSQLKQEAMEGQQYKQDAFKFKSELARVNGEQETLQQTINHDRQLFEREKSKNDNMLQHEKMLQDKQRNLLAKMETLNEENERMREEIISLEEERDEALEKLEGLEKNQCDEEKSSQQYQDIVDSQKTETQSLKSIIDSLENENKELKSAIEDYVERERLIVAYPDLNQGNVSSPMVQGSGDVLTDMRNQVKANNVRVQILEQENDALMKTLGNMSKSPIEAEDLSARFSSRNSTPRSFALTSKLSEEAHNQLSQPIQLWKKSDIALESDRHFDEVENSPEADLWRKHRQSKLPNERPPSRYDASRLKPPSGRHKPAFDSPNKANRRDDVPARNGVRLDNGGSTFSSTSIEAYKKIKQQQQQASNAQAGFMVRSSFTVGSGRRPKSGRPSSAKNALFKPWT